MNETGVTIKHHWLIIIVAAILAIAFLLITTQVALADGPIYVDSDAPGVNDGSSWSDAYTDLQHALTVANPGDEIWVAEGIYTPGTQLTATFQLKTGVALYGGFGGYGISETLRSQRDWVAYVTVLSGDLEGNDITTTNGVVTNTDNITGTNAYHVVIGSGADASAVLNGFTVTAGNAWGSSQPNNVGGGMVNEGGSPTLTNVTFSGNSALGGGGMDNYGSNPTLTNVTFSDNFSPFCGGGMDNYLSNPTLTNVTFSGNRVTFSAGGGMCNSSSSPSLINVTFSGNFAATFGGGGMVNNNSSPTLINVTFSGNLAEFTGGGMLNDNGSSPTLVNCILWANTPLTGQIDNRESSTPTISYSLIQGSGGSGAAWDAGLGVDGGGNLDADPLFVAPISATLAPTTTGNYRLQSSSPAIDAGNSLSVTVATDLDGHPRIVGLAVDMGAYEAQNVTPKDYFVYLPLVLR